jgi:hypothetical protein
MYSQNSIEVVTISVKTEIQVCSSNANIESYVVDTYANSVDIFNTHMDFSERYNCGVYSVVTPFNGPYSRSDGVTMNGYPTYNNPDGYVFIHVLLFFFFFMDINVDEISHCLTCFFVLYFLFKKIKKVNQSSNASFFGLNSKIQVH